MREEVEIDTVCDEGHDLSLIAWGVRPPPAGNGLVPHADEGGSIIDTLLCPLQGTSTRRPDTAASGKTGRLGRELLP